MNIDCRITDKFQQVGEITNIEPTNNEDQLRACIYMYTSVMKVVNLYS